MNLQTHLTSKQSYLKGQRELLCRVTTSKGSPGHDSESWALNTRVSLLLLLVGLFGGLRIDWKSIATRLVGGHPGGWEIKTGSESCGLSNNEERRQSQQQWWAAGTAKSLCGHQWKTYYPSADSLDLVPVPTVCASTRAVSHLSGCHPKHLWLSI